MSTSHPASGQISGQIPAKGPQGLRRGRGARERILAAATHLFAEQGINSTGMEQLCAEAGVSKRTVYQHFGSKDDLVAAYLHGLNVVPAVAEIGSALTPRDRLLAVFEQFLAPESAALCPFIGAAVEVADPSHPARAEARDYKHAISARLGEAAAEAGAREPEELGEELALLLDAATVRTRTLGADVSAVVMRVATMLVDDAVPG